LQNSFKTHSPCPSFLLSFAAPLPPPPPPPFFEREFDASKIKKKDEGLSTLYCEKEKEEEGFYTLHKNNKLNH